MSEEPKVIAEDPGVIDTYGLVYSFILLFLLPGVALLTTMHFGDDRGSTYTWQYVSSVTMPFVLGLVAVFLSDSRDSLRTTLVRTAVLVPIVVITGVTVMFASSILIVPVSGFIQPQNFGVLTPIAAGMLLLTAAPVAVAFVRRLRGRIGAVGFVHAAVMLLALVVVAWVVYATFKGEQSLLLARKDVVIYIIGALTWYLPSFGLAAGVWRRVGLV